MTVARSPARWAVLALVAEGRTHGFAVARALERAGPVGAVWAVPRPLVYRALELLEQELAIVAVATESTGSGPPRRLFEATTDGAADVRGWLYEPVEHVRDARSELLLKLLFLDRMGGDPEPLARAQAERFAALVAALEAQIAATSGFERTVLRWRLGSAQSALDFVNGLLT